MKLNQPNTKWNWTNQTQNEIRQPNKNEIMLTKRKWNYADQTQNEIRQPNKNEIMITKYKMKLDQPNTKFPQPNPK